MKNSVNVTVLIAEDNDFNASFISSVLTELGVASVIARDGQEALNYLQERAFDLIFMDCQMPNLDGYAATERIRGLGEEFNRIPIIALTASLSEELRIRCEVCGMNEAIQKPLELETLKQMLDKYIFLTKDKSVNQESLNAIANTYRTEAAEQLSKTMKFSYEAALGLIYDFHRLAVQITEQMERASDEGRTDEIISYAHQLKGMACNMRLKDIMQLASEIEKRSVYALEDRKLLQAILERLK